MYIDQYCMGGAWMKREGCSGECSSRLSIPGAHSPVEGHAFMYLSRYCPNTYLKHEGHKKDITDIYKSISKETGFNLGGEGGFLEESVFLSHHG